MRRFGQLFSLCSTLCFISNVAAIDATNEDIEALRDWINSRRMIVTKELGGQLSVSGDIHAELQIAHEKKGGKRVRGKGTDKPTDNYDAEFNLNVDYRADRGWAAARVKFDNDLGLTSEWGSGKNEKIKVDRAYFGYRLLDKEQHTLDVEFGRRPNINGLFESRLQYNSNFDGVNVKDSYTVDKVGDIYYQLGAFLVNEKRDQFGYIGEMGVLNIANTGLYAKYSMIDWATRTLSEFPSQFHFINSQMLLGYKFKSAKLDKSVTLYAAGIYNHRARPVEQTDYKKANTAAYVGFSVGQLKLAKDWSLDMNYQVVKAQALPDFDMGGVGLGTSKNGLYYTAVKDDKNKDKKQPSTRATAEGKGNYHGIEMTLQYLLSNNVNIFQQFKHAKTLNHAIGEPRSFNQYEIDFVFLF
jgi:hypothetical protein